jgi:hypothetical protein
MQKVNMKARNSKDYIGSVYVEDAGGMLELQDLRGFVTGMNTSLREYGAKDKYGRDIQYRIRVCGREPINKGEAKHWIFGTRKNVGYDWGGNVIGGIANANRLDVYIYRR